MNETMMDTNFDGAPRPSLVGSSHHRRALSDTFFDMDDMLLDDMVAAELDADGPLVPPSLPPKNGPDRAVQPSKSQSVKAHVRSLSVDAGFFDGLVFDAPVQANRPASRARSSSVDRNGSATSYEAESGHDSSSSSLKKAMASDRIAELSLIDPKRAKRILANRQSAARSKERKIRYTTELEKKVQTLQTEATNLSAQITSLQKDTSGLTSENRELQLKLQAMEQQAHLRDALNDALREELRWLKIAACQTSNVDRSN